MRFHAIFPEFADFDFRHIRQAVFVTTLNVIPPNFGYSIVENFKSVKYLN